MAPKVEQLYRVASRGGPKSFVVIRVLDGLGVIESLFIEGVEVAGRLIGEQH